MGSSVSAETFTSQDAVRETHDGLKSFIGAEYSKSSWYQILKQDFEENDEGKKGYLTKSEIDNTLEEYLSLKGISPTEELKEECFKKIDTDSTEKISLDKLYQFARSAVEAEFLPEFEQKCTQHNMEVWAC